MSSSKKKDTIVDRINEALKPKELTEERDENEAKFERFDEHIVNNQLSDIRKITAKSLSELDSKYKGKPVSRKEIEAEYGNSQSEDDLLTESDYQSILNDQESIESEVDDDSDISGSDEDENDSLDGSQEDYDDFDISNFINNQGNKSTVNESVQDTKLVNQQSVNDEVKKGICVQNQLKMWEKLLEVRIKAQKMLITANSFPDFDSFLELSEIEDTEFLNKVDDTCDGIYNLMDNLLELQSTLVERFSESTNVLKNCKRKGGDTNGSIMMKKSKLAQYADQLDDNYEAYSKFRNQVLQKWHDRTKSLKDSKNPVTNLNIITKIENALLGKNEIIKKTQIYRGDYEIYGKNIPKSDEHTQEIHIPEIFDDSDFYHQLLRELIEYKSNFGDNQSEITQKFIELQNVRSKMKKRVETRASKGRKIRYNVHNKLVNFMPPKDESEWTDEAKTELFNSLFGRAISNNNTQES